MKLKLGAVAAPVIGIGVSVVAYNHWPNLQGSVARGTAPVALSPFAVPVGQPEVAPTPPIATRTTPLAKANQVDALLKSPNPAQAYAGYKLVKACVTSRRIEVASKTEPFMAKGYVPPAEACDAHGIGPTQIVSRMEALNRAADAGVHGAALDVNREGPDGAGWQGVSEPVLAAFLERYRRQVQAGVDSGDPEAFRIVADCHQGAPNGLTEGVVDLALSLKYLVAENEASIAQTGKPVPHVASVIDGIARRLPKEEVAAAVEGGKQLIATAKSSPYWRVQ